MLLIFQIWSSLHFRSWQKKQKKGLNLLRLQRNIRISSGRLWLTNIKIVIWSRRRFWPVFPVFRKENIIFLWWEMSSRVFIASGCPDQSFLWKSLTRMIWKKDQNKGLIFIKTSEAGKKCWPEPMTFFGRLWCEILEKLITMTRRHCMWVQNILKIWGVKQKYLY